MQTLKKRVVLSALISFALLFTGPSFGQDQTRHSAGGFLGFTDRNDADFTVGGEYEYRLQGPWSVGAIVEYTPDASFDRDFTVAMATAHYRPANMSRLKLTGGAGIQFRDVGGDDLRFRIGAGYDVFVNGPLTVTPRIAVDFGDGDENIVLGATAMYNF